MPTNIAPSWGYVFNSSGGILTHGGQDYEDGALISEGSVIADPLPVGLSLLKTPAQHDPDLERWDNATRTVKPWTNDALIEEVRRMRNTNNDEIRRLGGTP